MMMKRTFHLKNTMLIALFALIGFALVSCGEDEGGGDTLIPVITGFSPDSGEPGDNVTITGTDLANATAVEFNGTGATIVSNTATEVVATVPEGATTGKISVRTEGGLAVSSGNFTVVVLGAPTVSSVSPKSVHIGENAVITGADMATVSSVKVGEVEATIVSVTETTVEFTVREGSEVGLNSLTVESDGGATTTATDETEFYVIKSDEGLIQTFDGEQEGMFTGSPDPEESTVYGVSSDATVQAESQALPTAIDENFFHFEGYSSEDISGSYAAIVANSSALPVGTYADYFSGAGESDIYFNIQVNVGDLPDGYDGVLFGLRMRFDGGDYEYTPTSAELAELGFSPDADGWYNLSIPASEFDNGKAIGTFAFTDMQRIAVAVRRNYGSGGTAGSQITEADGGVFYSLSFDNARISVGGPYSFPE